MDEIASTHVVDYIINTHTHFDHVEANEHYKKLTNATVLCHHKGQVAIDEEITQDGYEMEWKGNHFKFIFTPGHSQDGMCMIGNDQYIFTGDTLFVGKVGGTAKEHYAKQLYESLERLKQLPDELIVYPGHDFGPTPTSTLGHEKKENPFMTRDYEDYLWLKENWKQYKQEHGIE